MNNPDCSVCGERVFVPGVVRPEFGDYPLCTSPECRRVAGQRDRMDPSQFVHYLRVQKKIIRDNRQRRASRRKHIDELKADEVRENREILGHFLSQNPDVSTDDVDLLEIPSGLSEVSALTAERIHRYSDHLRKLINEALEYSDLAALPAEDDARRTVVDTANRFSEYPELRVMSDELCGICKGGCCTSGGDTAYINVHTIRRFMDENPGLTAEEVLYAYASRISPETVSSSCINQTRTGCALPRALRSDTCNGFYCESLSDWQGRNEEDRSRAVLAVQRSNTNWQRYPADGNSVVSVTLVRAGGIVPLTFDEAADATSSGTTD